MAGCSLQKVLESIAISLLFPIVAAWVAASYCIAAAATLTIMPSVLLAQRLYWACPFVPFVWRYNGFWRGSLMRLGFEGTYCMNVIRRMLTLPIRPDLPSFYILGFPKCGTTSLADHLKQHPAISSIDGLPWHPVLRKESHYFNGVFGRRHAHSTLLYKSFFPTVLTKWWAERIIGVPKWLCFDACPLSACLPHTAQRIANLTPNAKLIFMMRDPVAGVFSSEIMLRNMGFPLRWTCIEEVTWDDPRFKERDDERDLWDKLKQLQSDEVLPENLPELFYHRLGSLLRCGQYADRIEPYLKLFPKDKMMFIDFNEFVKNTEAVLDEVLRFVGADPRMYKFALLPPGMKTDYKGRRMHPTVARRLREHFSESNTKLYELLGRNFQWQDLEMN